MNAVQPIWEIRVGMRLSLAFRLQLRRPINNASLSHCTTRKKKSAEGRKERSPEQCSPLLRLLLSPLCPFPTLVSSSCKAKVGVPFFPFFISTCVCLYISFLGFYRSLAAKQSNIDHTLLRSYLTEKWGKRGTGHRAPHLPLYRLEFTVI